MWQKKLNPLRTSCSFGEKTYSKILTSKLIHRRPAGFEWLKIKKLYFCQLFRSGSITNKGLGLIGYPNVCTWMFCTNPIFNYPNFTFLLNGPVNLF